MGGGRVEGASDGWLAHNFAALVGRSGGLRSTERWSTIQRRTYEDDVWIVELASPPLIK